MQVRGGARSGAKVGPEVGRDRFAWLPSKAAASEPARTCVGIDPGTTGGACLMRPGLVVDWIAWWAPTPRVEGVRIHVHEAQTGRSLSFDEPDLWHALQHLPTPPRTWCCVEGLFVGGNTGGSVVPLAESAGVALAWASSRRLRLTARPMAARWRADLLAPPPRTPASTADALLADALAGRPQGGGSRLIAPEIVGDLGRANGHARDALAMAAWGCGLRLTRVI